MEKYWTNPGYLTTYHDIIISSTANFRFKRGRVVITPKYFEWPIGITPPHFFCACPKSGISGLCFHFKFTFILLEYMGATSLLYKVVFGPTAAWPIHMYRVCEGFLFIHWRPMGGFELTLNNPGGVVFSLI